MDRPPPNLQGNYDGSCTVCLRGTDSGLAFVGEAEWLAAGLQVLGVSDRHALALVGKFFESLGAEPGMVLDGEHTLPVRVCAECVGKANASFPPPGVVSLGLPVVRQSSGSE